MGKPPAKENQSGRPTDGNAQAQEDELEVLKAIYMEDFAETEAKGAWSVCMQLASRIKSHFDQHVLTDTPRKLLIEFCV